VVENLLFYIAGKVWRILSSSARRVPAALVEFPLAIGLGVEEIHIYILALIWQSTR